MGNDKRDKIGKKGYVPPKPPARIPKRKTGVNGGYSPPPPPKSPPPKNEKK